MAYVTQQALPTALSLHLHVCQFVIIHWANTSAMTQAVCVHHNVLAFQADAAASVTLTAMQCRDCVTSPELHCPASVPALTQSPQGLLPSLHCCSGSPGMPELQSLLHWTLDAAGTPVISRQSANMWVEGTRDMCQDTVLSSSKQLLE